MGGSAPRHSGALGWCRRPGGHQDRGLAPLRRLEAASDSLNPGRKGGVGASVHGPPWPPPPACPKPWCPPAWPAARCCPPVAAAQTEAGLRDSRGRGLDQVQVDRSPCPLACLLWGPHEHTAPPAWGRHVHLPTSSTPACAHVYVTALEGRAAQLRAGPWAVILSPTWQRPSGQLPQPTGAPRSPPARSAISSGEEGLEAGLPCPGLGSHQPRRSYESLPQPLCPLPGTQASLGLDLCWSVWCSALGLQEHRGLPRGG